MAKNHSRKRSSPFRATEESVILFSGYNKTYILMVPCGPNDATLRNCESQNDGGQERGNPTLLGVQRFVTKAFQQFELSCFSLRKARCPYGSIRSGTGLPTTQ